MIDVKTTLPKRFYEKNNAIGLYCVAHGIGLWMGLGYAAYLICLSEFLPLTVRLLLDALLMPVSGMAMFYTTTLAHEGFHGNLNRSRHISMLMGIGASSAIPLFVATGYTMIHWPHHLYTNTPEDPDFASYRRYRNGFSRVLMGPMESGASFFLNALNLVLRPDRGMVPNYPFTPDEARRFAILNLILVTAASTGYVALALFNMELFVFIVVLPMLVSTTYLGIVPYIDHSGTGLTKGENARSYTSWIFTAILLGTNYHREHHLYPNVPSYKLAAVHRFHQANGMLSANAVVEPGFLAALRIGVSGQLDR
jgi:beta-carotene hydroxylase